MPSEKTIRRIMIIAGTSLTATLSAILYVYLLTTSLTIPLTILDSMDVEVNVMSVAIVIGMLIFILLGILVRIWTRKLHLLCIGAAIGIIASGGWIEQKYSGHPSSGIFENPFGIVEYSIYHLTTTWTLVLPLFVSAVISWIITDFVVKKVITIKGRKTNNRSLYR